MHYMKNSRSASISRAKAIGNGKNDLAAKIRLGEFKIAIYGLGHVGSPLASTWLRAGAHVIGVDKSPEVLEIARKGRTHVPEPGGTRPAPGTKHPLPPALFTLRRARG